MGALPQELLRIIVSYLSRDDLFHLRLVNKPFASAAAPPLFHTKPLWIGIKSLEGLAAIAEHNELSNYVKEIVCSPLRFIDHKGIESTHKAEIRDLFEYDAGSTNAHALRYGKYMSAYKGYIEAQRYLTEDSLDVKIITRAFRKLPNLESLMVDWSNDYIGSGEIIRAFEKFEAEKLLSFDCVHLLPVLFRALSASGTQLQHLKLGLCEELMHHGSKNLTHVKQYSEHPLRSCPQPNRSYPKRIASRAIQDILHREDTRPKEVVGGLRTFHVGQMELDNSVELLNVVNSVRRVIDWASNLETIKIEELVLDFIDLPKPPLTLMMPAHRRIPKLRMLHLREINASLQEMVQFLRVYRRTLEDIEFMSVNLKEGDWSTALTRLRESKFPKLNHFVLGYFDDDELDSVDEFLVEDYILHKTDKDPIKEEKRRCAMTENN